MRLDRRRKSENGNDEEVYVVMMMQPSNVEKGKHKADNFENRLMIYHSFGRYIKTEKNVCDEGAVDEDVRTRIDLDSFNPRLTRHLDKFNKF